MVEADETALQDGGQVEKFAEVLKDIKRLSNRPPVLILDQFEDALRYEEGQALARLGPIFAATAQKLPGSTDYVCHWVLSYREEYHGEVVRWLSDVLVSAPKREAPGLRDLPHDLRRQERYHEWSLPAPATPPPGLDPVEASTRVFLDVIEHPLRAERPDRSPAYPWRFVSGEARRLATAFAQARHQRPRAPLAPELQVVLDYLLTRAEVGSPNEIRVSAEPASLIQDALYEQSMPFPREGEDVQVRVLRGGDFNLSAKELRSAYRWAVAPDYRDSALGFRVVTSKMGKVDY